MGARIADDDADACAGLVERGDPERFRTVLAAPRAKRAGLMALYAFNLEVARAPWVSAEPAIVEMRLRWWLDALAEIAAGAPPRRHQVVVPLAATIRDSSLPLAPFEALVAARLRDTDPAPLADGAALAAYVGATYGGLMELAARHLGAADAAAIATVRRFAQGAGTAALLAAVPALRARGRDPLPRDADIAALARAARADLAAARARRRDVPRACLAALLPGWRADAILKAAEADPSLATVAPSEARARASLAWRAVSGRW